MIIGQAKMLENQKAYLKDLEQSIDDFEKTGGKRRVFNSVGVNTPELEKLAGKFEKTISKKDFIKENENSKEAQKQLQGA